MVWVALFTLIVALPVSSSGLSGPAARTPHGPSSAAPSADVHLLAAPGAPATNSAQAIAAAQASLASAWGSSPTVTSSGCASGPTSCATHLSVGLPHPTVPLPNAKKAFYPPPVTGGSVAYDPAPLSGDSYVAMFGGLQTNGQPSAQTWIYESGYWENITPNASAKKPQPAARWDAMMAYDGNARDEFIVLFGGCIGRAVEGLCLNSANDTWKLYNGVWGQLTVAKLPSARYDSAFTYDPQLSSVVMFGGAAGIDDTPPPFGSCTPPAPTMDSDTWEFSESTGRATWTQIATGGTAPPAGFGGRLAYDTIDGAAVLFGGGDFYRVDHECSEPDELAQTTSGSIDTPTWILDGVGAWSAYGGVSPPDRTDANMASEGRGPIVVEGGANDTGTVLNDVWEFTDEAQGWTLLSGGMATGAPLNVTPVNRYDAGFAWDGYGPDSYFFMLGGTSTAGAIVGDAWSFSPPSGWTLQTPELTATTAPSSRYAESMVFDDALGAVVLFGGESCGASACTFLGDTWLYSSGSWQRLATSLAPSARFGASMDYDPWTGAILLFGGCGASCPLGDSWQFARPNPASAPVWRELFPSVAPPARYYAAMAFDAFDTETVLFGGCEGNRGPCPSSDTWVYNSTIANWKFVASASGSNAPPARFGAAMAALNRSQSAAPGSFNGTLLFGGQGDYGMLADTWNFSFWGTGPNRQGRWSEIQPELSPTPRVFGTLVFDPVDTSLILLGGCEPSQCPALDPWVFSLQSPPVASGGGGPPPPPSGVPAQPPPPPPPPATLPAWPWNSTNLTTNIQPGLPPLPPGPPRYGAAAVWDPIDGPTGYVLLVGGRTFSGATILETDEIAGYLWTNLANYG